MKKFKILMQMWLACAVIMSACSDLDEQIEQLTIQKESVEESIQSEDIDEALPETKAVKYTNVQTITLTTHGTLKELLGDNLTTTDKLIISGPIDAADVDVFRNQMTALKAIDMTDATFVESDFTYTYNETWGSKASLEAEVISETMFSGLDNFIEIKLPKEVTRLDGRTFKDCSALQTIELPENLEILGSEYTFSDCSSLVSIVIPEKITVIPEDCFYRCTSLKSVTLPQGLSEIGNYAFYNCKVLSSITLPEKLNAIGAYAFCECVSLEKITIPASINSWGDNDNFVGYNNSAFLDCSKLSTVILEEGLTSLGSYMFQRCTALKQIEIPSTVKKIPSHCFAYCDALETVVVNTGVEKVGDFVFYSCESLTTIELPETLLEIGNYAFSESTFTVIDFLPSSLVKIGEGAFRDSKNLTTIILPDNVETLTETFLGCSNLKNVTLPKNLKELGAQVFRSAGIESIVLPETLTTLGNYAFEGCRYLKEIKIPELVTVIPKDCFSSCSSLVSVSLPDGITRIEYAAFHSCDELTGVKLPASLQFMGSSSFAYCPKLTLASPILPETLTEMESDVFYEDVAITELIFPTGLNEIASSTCSGCTALKRVVISEGTTQIGSSAFANAHVLTDASITLPSTIKTIASYAFENTGITSLSFLPDGVETIESYAFADCPIKDKVLTLPSITSIGRGAFENNNTIGAIYITGTQDVVFGDIFNQASNCLIYTSAKVTLPSNEHIYNKITNGTCLKLRLVEDSPWYCPEAFAVGMVTLTKQFNQDHYSTTVYATSGKASNWYAFNMPFVPTEITSDDGRTWAPFNAGVEDAKPFWLRKLTTDSKKPFVDVTEFEANVPYIISFPSNNNYADEYNLSGDITFSAANITIPESGEQVVLNGPYYAMYSSYEPIPQASSVYLLNSAHYSPDGVRRDYSDIWGSAFEQSLRESWAWEPYISFSSPTTTRTISLDGASTRGHKEVGSIPSIDDM